MKYEKQIFKMPVVDVIKSRTSIRTYKKQPLPKDVRQNVVNFFNELKGPFDVGIRLELIEGASTPEDSDIKLGTYGMIRGATSFIAAAVEAADKNLEEVGYVFEKLVLYIASLGLGTCWLGGSFNKGQFAKAISLKEKEILPVVTPIGYAADSRSLVDSMVRFAAGSKKRKDWEELFFKNSFNDRLSLSDAGKYSVPLEMVRLGPSASNKQPWRIMLENNRLHFYLQHTAGYAKALGYDIQRIDMGIAMCHFELTAKELGIKGTWKFIKPEAAAQQNSEYIISWIED